MINDREVLRELAKQVAYLANLDIQKKKIQMWKDLNSLKPQRPMVTIDQLPWNELNMNDELTLLCSDPLSRELENKMRITLYSYKHFPVDMVVNNYIEMPRIAYNNQIGPKIEENTISTDNTSTVVAHRYIDLLQTEEDLEAIAFPDVKIAHEYEEMRLTLANELIGDIISLKPTGFSIHCGVWDFITQLRGVENIMYDFADRPEFMLKTVNKFVDITLSLIDQYEELGLLEYNQTLVHCTGAFNDELPASPKDNGKQSARDVWGMGLAQTLGTVSPEMYNEFELKPIKRLLDRFGLIYYGCCDPIEKKIDYLREIKNIRKISVSPWANKEMCAERMHGDYVFSTKPNPSYLAFDTFDEDIIRKELIEAAEVCRKYNTNCEFILKDVSTVKYKPQNLERWAKIAMEIAESY